MWLTHVPESGALSTPIDKRILDPLDRRPNHPAAAAFPVVDATGRQGVEALQNQADTALGS